MAKISQEGRPAQFVSPKGKDPMALLSFTASEGLSELFEIRVEVLSEDESLNFDEYIGKNHHIEYTLANGKMRIFNGILTEARALGGNPDDLYRYSVTLRPWLWLLAHRHDCRVFLNKTVMDIVKEVFDEDSVSSLWDDRTQQSYPKIPYCVQYRESDYAFVSRMLEEHGIYYFFEHTEGMHKMVLAAGAGSHTTNTTEGTIPADGPKPGYTQYLTDWVHERRYAVNKVELNDYDYLEPGKKLLVKEEGSAGHDRKAEASVYDYPGRYDQEGRGGQLAKFRLEAERASDQKRYAEGWAPALFPGTLFTPTEHAMKKQDGDYLVVRCHHLFSGQSYLSLGGSEEVSYRGAYQFLPQSQPFRAPALTPRPKIYGSQTAVVVAKDKSEEQEEISTDEHGRIWVRFHWDRDKLVSCPVRVAHSWAGPSWGEMFLPRIDQEVVVEFLEGDPDYPLITGAVYNGKNKVPYKLPDNKTQSGWKTDSSKNANGYNEIMFEDKADKEEIRVQAQKDMNVTVLNDLDTKVLHSEKRTIGEKFEVPMGSPARKTVIAKGDDNLNAQSGRIMYEAAMMIELKVGPSKVVITPTGILLDAPTVTIKGLGSVTINGAVVMIN